MLCQQILPFQYQWPDSDGNRLSYDGGRGGGGGGLKYMHCTVHIMIIIV